MHNSSLFSYHLHPISLFSILSQTSIASIYDLGFKWDNLPTCPRCKYLDFLTKKPPRHTEKNSRVNEDRRWKWTGSSACQSRSGEIPLWSDNAKVRRDILIWRRLLATERGIHKEWIPDLPQRWHSRVAQDQRIRTKELGLVGEAIEWYSGDERWNSRSLSQEHLQSNWEFSPWVKGDAPPLFGISCAQEKHGVE